MAGRAAMRTPKPPDRDEYKESPPRLSRPKRTTRLPNSYTRDNFGQLSDRERRPKCYLTYERGY
ncbi:hypothetical protein N7519_008053 [Penicillium mononematosum]|uniref:uncharacterized protein n=1 Tax=Penicillium mononematosum TaxID=268346 RepID=UPI0025472E40|nr:uncharacterized protein N7519_008053 [Penicillium mononematosum]KAJ6186752.1 hypothetical protein N7519_008053 [Penicillium mononematosum]